MQLYFLSPSRNPLFFNTKLFHFLNTALYRFSTTTL
jgi:hypothetical protein